MFCRNCGEKLSPGSKFCEDCGHPISEQIAKSGHCKNCKSALPADALYCPECGENVEGAGEKDAETTAVRPWVRYWARYIDYFIFAVVFGLALGVFMPSALENTSELVLGIIIVFAWMFVESILLSSLGTTPGKWLLKIKLQNREGQKPEFSSALNRSFNVWLKGIGLGIPIVAIFTLLNSYNHLKKESATSWDKEGNFSISHRKVGLFRTIIAILIFAAFVLLIYLGETS